MDCIRWWCFSCRIVFQLLPNFLYYFGSPFTLLFCSFPQLGFLAFNQIESSTPNLSALVMFLLNPAFASSFFGASSPSIFTPASVSFTDLDSILYSGGRRVISTTEKSSEIQRQRKRKDSQREAR